MNTIDELRLKIHRAVKDSTWCDIKWEIKKILLSSDSSELLEFHYLLLTDLQLNSDIRNDILRFFSSNIENKRDEKIVGIFLRRKFETEHNELLKADLMQLLGNIRSPYALELAKENIFSKIRDFRYRSIIVMGWVGSSKDLQQLNESMLSDEDGELRCYAATAMRQIWYKHSNTRDKIMKYIKIAISAENDEEALVGMIITIQDMYEKKLGIKESRYGDISGDTTSAKEKTIKFLLKL